MGAAGPACAAREPPLSREPALRSVLRHVRLENLAAGMSGGVLSTLALHPLDLVKIRFAVSDGLELRPKYNGILHCMSTVWKHEGLRGLYQGVTPNMVGAGASWGLYFFFYNAIKAYKKEGKMESLSASEHLVSAAEAGAMTLCITNPIWVTKTRLVLQYNAGVDPSKRQYRGMFDALIKIYKTEGIRGLYKVLRSDISVSGFHIKDGNIFHHEGIRVVMATSVSCLHKLSEQGTQMLQVSDTLRARMKAALERLQEGFVPGLFGTSHGALQFMAYEDLKERYNKYRNRVSDTKLNTVEYIMMAAVSKIFAVVATYPYQVVRARLQDQHNTYSGVFDVIHRTWRYLKTILQASENIAVLQRQNTSCVTRWLAANLTHHLAVEQARVLPSLQVSSPGICNNSYRQGLPILGQIVQLVQKRK